MKERFMFVVVFSFWHMCLLCGYTAEYVKETFGRGGILNVKSDVGIYDFSKDGKYLWLSETNCLDLVGDSADISKLYDSSHPLPRMKWKERIFGTAWNYFFSDLETANKIDRRTIEAQVVRWVGENLVSESGCTPELLSSRLTFPAFAAPFVAAVVRVCGTKYIVLGVFNESDDIGIAFRSIKIPKKIEPLIGQDLTVSESKNCIASRRLGFGTGKAMYSLHNEFKLSNMYADFTLGRMDVSNEVVVADSELKHALCDDGLYTETFCGYGFLNDRYFWFTGRNGGRSSFFARDYLFVYGFQEKRVVKVFKSHLRLFSEGYHINDVDVVLSADERHLAIRYDGVLTIYPFFH